jgi:hypothetical protein
MSCNGIQHLAALTLDEVTAEHVNLVPTEFPGDLYSYVAEFVWKALGNVITDLDKQEMIYLTHFVDEVLELSGKIRTADGEQRERLVTELRSLRELHKVRFEAAGHLFWTKIEKKKDRRKICKR